MCKSFLKRLLPVVVCGLSACGHAAPTKTLVAWVYLDNTTQQGGSALTIQRGKQFDAIVFGEKAAGKWMAGSNYFRRTQDDQQSNAAETAAADTLIQMAIVYTEQRITIWRNGEMYADYAAANIDLLSAPDNIAVFGLRHEGATTRQTLAGKIEDARIYDRALTQAEISALRPDQPSTIKPYAWWTFEPGQETDRAGRFAINVLSGGAKIEDGMLKLQSGGKLVAHMPASSVPPEQLAMPENPPATWLTYHLAHPGPSGARPGDPNPAFYYRGRYHLHYIYNHKDGFAYAHVSSTDMVHWKWHPTTITPKTMGHGMFSGTGFFTRNGTPAMIYHGQGSGRNQLAFALDDNLEHWSQPQAIEPFTAAGEKPKMRHWDPDCWFMDNAFYALSGGENPKLMKSADLRNWLYLGDLFHESFSTDLGVAKGEDVSCANMFRLGNKWMLLCISHGLGTRYYLGDFIDEKYLPSHHGMMNWAKWDCFAPESLLTPDGRRVMWAWCTPWTNTMQRVGRSKNFDALLNQAVFQQGIQSLPRELSLPEDGVLRIKPLRELEALRYDRQEQRKITVPGEAQQLLSGISGDTLELEVVFSARQAQKFGINLLCDAKGDNGFKISCDAVSGNLNVGYVTPSFQVKASEDLTLRLFIDKSMIEVFVNERHAVVAWHEYPPDNRHISLFAKGGNLLVKKMTAWKLKSIYAGNCVFDPAASKKQ
jgi:sucrose-6-phosphate hydrolase SacC (GH32 family)